MSAIDEVKVSNFIAEQIKIDFTGKQYKLNTWGQVDKWIELEDNIHVFIEIETKQKHPNTNVMKLWPYLEENSEIRIFLIQTFFPNSPGMKSNRGRLGEWIAEKLKQLFPKRFEYSKLVIDGINDKYELELILTKLNQFRGK